MLSGAWGLYGAMTLNEHCAIFLLRLIRGNIVPMALLFAAKTQPLSIVCTPWHSSFCRLGQIGVWDASVHVSYCVKTRRLWSPRPQFKSLTWLSIRFKSPSFNG